jgi:hypothetical protein
MGQLTKIPQHRRRKLMQFGPDIEGIILNDQDLDCWVEHGIAQTGKRQQLSSTGAAAKLRIGAHCIGAVVRGHLAQKSFICSNSPVLISRTRAAVTSRLSQ